MKRKLWQRVCAFGVAMLLIVSLVPPLETNAVGEWANVHIWQGKVNHPSGCTVCTLQLIYQNSATLKSEWQLEAGVQQSWSGKYKEFDLKCADNGSGNGISEPINVSASNKTSDSVRSYNFVSVARNICQSDVVWESIKSGSVGDQSIKPYSSSSSVVTGLGSKDFHSMSKQELITSFKLLWNAGYWVVVAIKYNNGKATGNGPDGYKANHWVMFSGVDDNNFYINDPGYGKSGGFYNNSSWSHYSTVEYVVIYKNNKTTPMSRANGEVLPLTPSDSSSLGSLGVSEQFANSISPNLNMSLSNDALLSSCRLQEANLEGILEFADADNLAQDDLEVLEGWRTNIGGNKKESGFIATLRWIVSMVGILITVWAVFIYLAFWFDHINSFVYLDMLHILTLGKLHICSPGEKPTFSLGKDVKDKTVSHWQICCICITAIVFGATLISGLFYNAVTALVRFIQGLIV